MILQTLSPSHSQVLESVHNITVDDKKIVAKQWQPVSKPKYCPIVLLHDSLGSISLWRDFPAQLASRTQRIVIAYDRIGYGQSDPITHPQPHDFITREAHIVFPAIKSYFALQEFVVIGHSVGGCMALNIAATDSQCQAVVSMSAASCVEPQTLQGIRDVQKQFAESDKMLRLSKHHGNKAEWVFNAWTSIWLSDAFADWNLDYCLDDVRCKAFIIHGENDEYGSLDSPERMVQKIGGKTRKFYIKNCGHIPHREAPDEVLAQLQDFLTSTEEA